MHMSSIQDLNQLSAYFHKLDSNSVAVSDEDEPLETENFVVQSDGFLDSLRNLDYYISNTTDSPQIVRKKSRVFSITTDNICSIPSVLDSLDPLKLPPRHQNFSDTQGQPDPESPETKLIQEPELCDVDILCVNCYECIPMNEVDFHSDICCRNISIIPEGDDDTDLRIYKLQSAMKERQNLVDFENLEILIKLQEISYALLENSLSMNFITNSIESVLSDCLALPNSYGCILFARRLAILADLKISDLPKDISFLDDEKLQIYEDELIHQKQELSRWKMRNELLLQLAGMTDPHGLPNITSDLDESDYSMISYNSVQSESAVPQIDSYSNYSLTGSLKEMAEEDQEKLFYSVLLKKKFSLPRDHIGRDVSIKEVYEIVRRQNIPVTYWDYFLDDLLMNI